MATLSDFPIGTKFYYLGHLMLVIEHRLTDYENGQDYDALDCHYRNVDGTIDVITFHAQSFDYLKTIVTSQNDILHNDAIGR